MAFSPMNKRNVLILLSLVFFGIALQSGLKALYIAASYVTAMLFTAYLFSRRALSHLEVSISDVENCVAKQEMPMVVTLENRGYFTRYAIGIEVVIVSTEGKCTLTSPLIHRIKPNDIHHLSLPFTPELRGHFQITSVRLRSSFPFDLFDVSKTFSVKRSFWVYPDAIYPALSLKLNAILAPSHFAIGGLPSGGCEFIGVRDYKMGDSIRHIHWPSTARLGRLIVKEYEDSTDTEVMIFLNCSSQNAKPGIQSTFEHGVRTAAGFSRYFLEQGYPTGLSVDPFWHKPHRGMAQHQAILFTLAKVGLQDVPFETLFLKTLSKLKFGTMLILLMLMDHPVDMAWIRACLQKRRMNFLEINIF